MSRPGRLLPLPGEYVRIQTQLASVPLEGPGGSNLLDDLEVQLHLIAGTWATNIRELKAKLAVYAELLGSIDGGYDRGTVHPVSDR